ncbi:MAG: polysaccharide deacetylase family protein [Clostridia bacterium]|nr:polysaccharide deacetylase family protein [Clostridia bacterium]
MQCKFMRFPEGKSKCVTLSYDDARDHDIRFSQMLNKYGLKCTFNISYDFVNRKHYLTPDQIREHLLAHGHEVAVHGQRHRATGQLRPIEIIQEVLENRIALEQEFDMIIRGFAYPDSGINAFANPDYSYEKVVEVLKDLDIVYGRTISRDNNSFALPTDWHCWIPTAHHNNPKIFEWIDEFLAIDNSPNQYGPARRPRLFYLWGHSFEFDSNNNWERGEEICKKLSGNEDVWYATNIEIYDYIAAYNSLVFSADGTQVYNPTLIDIWLDIDKTLYKVKSGEKIKF